MICPALARLIEEKLPGQRYAIFWATGEGDFLPNGEEESSGYVIIPSGEIWFWWTGWDAERQRVWFPIWEPEHIDLSLHPDCEYAQAREELGLV